MTWVPNAINTLAAISAIVIGWHQVQNLRRRNVKELLGLITEAENRFEKESAKGWRYPDAKVPKGPFEDSLGKDLLASQIFGRAITWSDWTEIRKFLTDHENIGDNLLLGLNLLRCAWPYRDRTRSPHIYFRMMWRICLSFLGYVLISLGTFFLIISALILLQIYYLNPGALEWLTGVQSKSLTSFEIYLHSINILALWSFFLGSLFLLLANVTFNYGGYAARLICRSGQRY